MIKHLQQLVKSFDHAYGLPGDAYEATLELINDILGEKSASVFRDAIKATDGGYYLSEGSGEAVWQAIYH